MEENYVINWGYGLNKERFIFSSNHIVTNISYVQKINLKSQLPKPIIKEERVEQIESQASFQNHSQF